MQNVLLLMLLGLTPTKESFDFNFSQTHDKGVYARLELGLGYTTLETSSANEKTATNGFGFTPSIALGSLIKKNLALHASGFGIITPDHGRYAIGFGATQYLTDSFFVSLSIGPMFGSDQKNGLQVSAAGELSLGLMGWLSGESQLGIVAHLSGETFDIDGDDVRQSGWRAGVRFGYSFH